MQHYFTLNTIVEIICFLIALICLKKDNDVVWRSAILFLFITCVMEMTGIYVKRLYLADRLHIPSNAWVYNILILFQAGFFSLMFQHLLKKHSYSRFIIVGGFALLIILHIYEIISQSIFVYDSLTNTAMSVLFVLYSFYFYYCLIKDDMYINLKYSPAFWWVAGTLFFYFGTTVSNLFYEKLTSIVVNSKHNLIYLKYLYNSFNILLYGCWSYSFICKKWLITTSKS
jgi:hypothetical protein